MEPRDGYHWAMACDASINLLKKGKYDQLYGFLREELLDHGILPDVDPVVEHQLPYIDDKGVDAFGDGELCFASWGYHSKCVLLIHVVCLTLAKIRTLTDLLALAQTRKTVGRLVPEEILGFIQYYVAGNSTILKYKPFINAVDIAEPVSILKNQIDLLYHRIDTLNPLFWEFLRLEEMPSAGIVFDYEDKEQEWAIDCHQALLRTREIWLETPGALKMMGKCMSGSGCIFGKGKITDTPPY